MNLFYDNASTDKQNMGTLVRKILKRKKQIKKRKSIKHSKKPSTILIPALVITPETNQKKRLQRHPLKTIRTMVREPKQGIWEITLVYKY